MPAKTDLKWMKTPLPPFPDFKPRGRTILK
jgi:hypothetical protein